MRTTLFALLGACLMLAACGGDKRAASAPQASSESLPQPDAAGGSVTGMPNPGTPATLRPPVQAMVADDLDSSVGSEVGITDDPALPAEPPAMTFDGVNGNPQADAIQVMPAHPPEANPPSQPVPPTEP